MSIGHPDFYGTALVHGVTLLTPLNSTLAIPAGSSANTAQQVLSAPGYTITLAVTVANAASTIPFAAVELQWFDPTGAVMLYRQKWVVPATSSGTYTVTGSGPTRGAVFELVVTNPDPTYAMTMTYSMVQTTQHIARDDWRAMSPGGTIPLWTQAIGDPAENILINENAISLTAGNSVTWLMPLYAGNAWFNFLATAATQVNVGTWSVLPSSFGGTLFLYQNLSVTDVSIELVLPRVPCYVEFINHGTAAHTVDAYGTFLEYTS